MTIAHRSMPAATRFWPAWSISAAVQPFGWPGALRRCRLHPQIGPGQSGLPQGAQFLRRLAQGAPGAGVGGHLLELREGSIQLLQDLEQLLRPHHNGIPRP